MRQLALSLPNTWGGRRKGAGPRPKGPRPGVSHRSRPYHDAAHPAHVTLRAVSGLASLRASRVFPAVREAIAGARGGRAFRVCHFSVQSNHIHLLVEAKDWQSLSRGMQGLAIRLARAVNRAFRRKGKVFGDRYHRRDLATPREVRNALVYVLMNHKKHGAVSQALDWCASAAWFDGWRERRARPGGESLMPVQRAETWLLRVGWRRLGPIGADEEPKGS